MAVEILRRQALPCKRHAGEVSFQGQLTLLTAATDVIHHVGAEGACEDLLKFFCAFREFQGR